MPPYKTIVLELLQDRPGLYDQLLASRTLLQSVQQLAASLRQCHQSRMMGLTEVRAYSDPAQISSEALELALTELQDSLPPASPSDGTSETFSLDAAMTFLQRHMPAE